MRTGGGLPRPRVDPAVVSPPRRGNSGSGESHAGSRRRRGDCSPAGQGPPAFLPVGGAPITDHPFLTRNAWRGGYHVLEIGVSVHTVVLRLPNNGRNLVAPGCVECRALPHFALWCAAKVRDYWTRGLRIPYPPP